MAQHIGSARKAEQLGMPWGMACGRLRKLILFNLLQQLGQNICFRCNQVIESAYVLSIEHKVPWQGNDPDLFWDMDNIAFSHLGCNIRAANRTVQSTLLSQWIRQNRKVGPPGTVWCSGHQDFLPVESFFRKQSEWSGFDVYCKQCRASGKGHAKR